MEDLEGKAQEVNSANDYNLREVRTGRTTGRHLSQLGEYWQERHRLKLDGKIGPATRASLDSTHRDPTVDLQTLAPSLAAQALRVALSELGNGEESRNNAGKHVIRYRNGRDTLGAWCASFVSYCFERAARQLGVEFLLRSAGARRLYKNIGRSGKFLGKDPRLVLPGDIGCYARGKSWQGHIFQIERYADGLLYTVEANVGTFPARVRRMQHDVAHETNLIGFARLG
ncbi:hypothetical protein LCGC14_2592260 [marine sediment metagenome]|uniref:Peptidase C51 domain-containing protein n=1 Tax=marine sediment metagenome TaxID=412755 RepID=A0A0F9CME1_9ZZZZ